MGYKSITQIVLFITGLVIVFTYIQPSFISIKETQDEVFEYSDASDKASELNAQLSQLLRAEQSFSRTDMTALETYLPSVIDEIAVMSDITAMAKNSGAQVSELTSGESQLPDEGVVFGGESVESDGTSYVDFNLSVAATYDSFKTMLASFEQNKYPLEIISLSFGEFLLDEENVETSIDASSAIEGEYEIILRTYAYSNINN